MTRKGFTLAEVLVTLVIIGVVAALTIPALLQNANQSEFKSAFKKSLATLNQAVVMSIAQDSTDTATCTNCGGGNTTGLSQFFIGKLNVLSQNGTAATPYFYTVDGIKYEFEKADGLCGASTSVDPATANCVVKVDVNGGKKPGAESVGTNSTTYSYKDQYRLIIKTSSVLPASNADNNIAVQTLQE
ncbi:MAG: hypothetical protein A2287_06030 [Candidatus Melainabacteria bacterium RIFOXYA12_FULL_32_12]|nr:MAG: hypothetical protein A2255_06525 [Candidatus Melainabacteria bacterium RIFOXYA2_FULL_32_9]OGI28932.1 MAG: hypothetical protein A2287_06030 [Candidatus Melainabacteria bacterium RIFOXYA12_FULL_32_12]